MTLSADQFRNPVLHSDFADPDVLKAGDTYYAYATSANGRNVQVAKSPDLINWEILTDAMPALAPWVDLGNPRVWAPDVIQIGDKFVLYYTAHDQASDKQCVGVATSDKPQGKFKDTTDHALVCPADQGGAIDASAFQGGDKLYLYWKNDGNCCGYTDYLQVQELAPDGLTVTTQPVQLVSNDKVWEGSVVEAPVMWKDDDTYYLFFSANDYAGLKYAVGYATCKSPTGPCEQAPENPILQTALKNPPVIGPGGETLIQVGDQTWMLYHAWEANEGVKTNRRLMWLDKVDWKDGKPVVEGPTTDPEAKPKP
jgi:beta-xylosidase